MDKSGFLAIKEALEKNNLPVNKETIKAFLVGEMELIRSNVEAELTGKNTPEEILEMNTNRFEQQGGHPVGDNQSYYELDVEGLDEFLSEILGNERGV